MKPSFEDNIGLVYKVFNDSFFMYRDIENDLLQEGNIGLLKATKTFNPKKKIAFSTYATKCIVNEMNMFLRKENRWRCNVESLSTFTDEDGEESYLLADETSCEERDAHLVVGEILELARKQKCYLIIKEKLAGKTQAQIAKKYNKSEWYISIKMKEFYNFIKNKIDI